MDQERGGAGEKGTYNTHPHMRLHPHPHPHPHPQPHPHTHTHTHTHTHMHTRMHIHTQTRTHARARTHIRTSTPKFQGLQCRHIHPHIHTFTGTYTQSPTHTFVHTYIHARIIQTFTTHTCIKIHTSVYNTSIRTKTHAHATIHVISNDKHPQQTTRLNPAYRTIQDNLNSDFVQNSLGTKKTMVTNTVGTRSWTYGTC